MNAPIRIVVADDEPEIRDYFVKVLPRLGYEVVGTADNGRRLVELVKELHPDLVLTDIKMPVLDGIEAATEIYREHPVPVILVSAHHDPALIERAEADHILAYLIKPVKQADLQPAISIALRRFGQFEALRKEAADLRQALEDRKLIERAKGILMKRAGLDEHEAFRRMQRLSNERNCKLVALADMILTTEQALS